MSDLNPKVFRGKTVLITGGTGSFGGTFVRRLLQGDVGEVRIFSRDEAKQYAMRFALDDDRAKFYLGDVRDKDSLDLAMRGVDYVFHAAALKQVPNCENFPDQAILTNALGSQNVIRAAIRADVERMVCLSTDKAVYPVNAMGMSKALMEKLVQSESRHFSDKKHSTTLSIVRYGNVMCTRGSIIPLFVDKIKNGEPLTLTIPTMTRFLLSLNQSVDLVETAFAHGNPGDLFIRKSAACTVAVLTDAIKQAMNVPDHEVIIAGIRPGEKIHECLASSLEMNQSVDMGQYLKVVNDKSDMIDSNSDYSMDIQDYTSEVTRQLDVDEVTALLLALPEFQKLVA